MSGDGETGVDVDLFGNPIQPLRDRRGRPSFAKTPENQQFVALRAAAGWTQEAIAADMGIDPKTLRKNFSRELEHGATIVEGQRLDLLDAKARQGNVSAIKALGETVERGRLHRSARRFAGKGDDAPKAPEAEGKKKAAQRAAEAVVQGDGLFRPGYEH